MNNLIFQRCLTEGSVGHNRSLKSGQTQVSFLAKAFPGVYVFLIWRLEGSAFVCNFLSFILVKATEGSCLNAISLKDTRWYYLPHDGPLKYLINDVDTPSYRRCMTDRIYIRCPHLFAVFQNNYLVSYQSTKTVIDFKRFCFLFLFLLKKFIFGQYTKKCTLV